MAKTKPTPALGFTEMPETKYGEHELQRARRIRLEAMNELALAQKHLGRAKSLMMEVFP